MIAMQNMEWDILALQVLGLNKGAGLADIGEAYTRLTTDARFQKVILGDEYLEKEFKHYYEAYALLLNQYAEAGGSAESPYRHQSQVAVALFNSGVYHLLVHNYLKAGEKFQEAYKINSRDILVLVYLGIILMKRKSYYVAEKYFLDAVKIDAQYEDAWFYLAENYARAGNYKKSLAMYEKVKILNPTRKDLSIHIKEAREKLGIKPGAETRKNLGQKLSGLFKKS